MIFGVQTGAMPPASPLGFILLDTDALIDYSKGFVESVEFIDRLDQDGAIFSTCSIVVAEFESGLDPSLLPRLHPYLDRLTYLYTSQAAARQAGRWRYEFKRRGAALSLSDCLIAATALDHGAQIVTANLKDYPMPGVRILALPRAHR